MLFRNTTVSTIKLKMREYAVRQEVCSPVREYAGESSSEWSLAVTVCMGMRPVQAQVTASRGQP